MKKKVLYGILLFIVGMAMVACGDKNSGSSSTPQQLTPAIPVTNGGLAPTNSGCQNSVCTYTGRVYVSQPEVFVLMGSRQMFATGGSDGGVSIGDIDGWEDVWDIFFGGIYIEGTVDGDGNRDIDVGFTGGSFQNSQGLADVPTAGTSYSTSMYVQNNGNLIMSYTISSGHVQGFEGTPLQNNSNGNSGTIYVDYNNKMVLAPEVTSAGNVTRFKVFLIRNNSLSQVNEAGYLNLDRVY